MQKINDWENVQASGDYKKPGEGGYVFVIDSVLDKTTANGKAYLEILCDIAEGEFAGYAKQAEFANGNKYSYRKMKAYYQGKASGMFKRFIEAVAQCNNGFKWDWDEQKLVGMKFGAVLKEREYIDNNGDTPKVALATEIHYPSTTTIEKIRKGDFKLVPIEKLDPSLVPATASVDSGNVDDTDLPF